MKRKSPQKELHVKNKSVNTDIDCDGFSREQRDEFQKLVENNKNIAQDELDKRLVSLSIGGIGLTITLMGAIIKFSIMWPTCIVVAWVIWILVIILTLLSHHLTITISNKVSVAISQGDSMMSLPGKKGNKTIEIINGTNLLLFILALLFLLLS